MYASTGQGFVGNNMFAYCLNNPVAYSDSQGTDARTCLTADGAIDDTPWWDHSPSGGGVIYNYKTKDPDYSGDKFLTQIALRHVGNFFEAWWEAYVHSNELQVQQQYQQHMETKAFIIDRFSTSQKRSNTYGVIGTTVVLGAEIGTAISCYGAYAAATTAAAATAATGGLVIAIMAVVGTSFLLAQQIENVMAEDGG